MANYKYIICKTEFDNGSTNAIQTYGNGSAGGKKPPEGYAWFPEEFMDNFYPKADPRDGKSPKCAGFVTKTFAPGTDDDGNDIGDVCTSCEFDWNAYDTYIATLPSPVPGLQASKTSEMSNICNQTITAGTDVVFSEAATMAEGDEASEPIVEHFSLTTEDQANIMSLFNFVLMGGTEYIYHSDGNPCRVYTAEEIAKIYITSQMFISQNITYNNLIKRYIATLDTEEALQEVVWGMELPEEYQNEYNELMAAAQAQINTVVAGLMAKMASADAE